MYIIILEPKKKNFRKFFKFQILNPLSVKTKVNSLQDGRIFLEAQVQNSTGIPIYLERLRFEPNDLFYYQDLNFPLIIGNTDPPAPTPIPAVEAVDSKNENRSSSSLEISLQLNSEILNSTNSSSLNNASVNDSILKTYNKYLVTGGEDGKISSIGKSNIFGSENYFGPQDTRQYLYILESKDVYNKNDANNAGGGGDQDLNLHKNNFARNTTTLGKLDIVWKSQLGQMGRLQTSQLSRKITNTDYYTISILEITPTKITTETPFTINCLLTNNSDSEPLTVNIIAIKSRMSSILLQGCNEFIVGPIAPLSHEKFQMKFFPLLTGLFKITGIRIQELGNGKINDIDSLVDVFVSP